MSRKVWRGMDGLPYQEQRWLAEQEWRRREHKISKVAQYRP